MPAKIGSPQGGGGDLEGAGDGGSEEDGVVMPTKDGEEEDQQQQHHQQQLQQKGKWYKKKFRRAKEPFLSPFLKLKKFFNAKRAPSFSSPSSFHYYYGDNPAKHCRLRFLQPPYTSDSAPGSKVNKPDNPNLSYYDFVKSLIETNDYYAAECNAHRDVG